MAQTGVNERLHMSQFLFIHLTLERTGCNGATRGDCGISVALRRTRPGAQRAGLSSISNRCSSLPFTRPGKKEKKKKKKKKSLCFSRLPVKAEAPSSRTRGPTLVSRHVSSSHRSINNRTVKNTGSERHYTPKPKKQKSGFKSQSRSHLEVSALDARAV